MNTKRSYCLRIAVPAAALAVALLALPLAAQTAPIETEDQKTLYVMGLVIAQNLAQFQFTDAELKSVQAGLADGALGREPKVALEEYGPKLQEYVQQRVTRLAEAEKSEATSFLAGEAAKQGAVQKESGLILTELSAGSGASPAATDTVQVHYHGTLRDGTVFDSSVDRGEPVSFALNQVIPCWTEGVQTMKVGGKSRLVCPAAIAYGDQGRPPKIPGGAALVFEVELLDIVAQTEAVAPPAADQ